MKTKFYVMHYKQAPERKDILQPKLDELGIDVEWYTDYDQEDLTEEVIEELYSEDLELFRHRMNGWKTEEDYRNYKGITKSHLSLVIKFIKCIEIMAESDYDNVVFFEDDVIFNDGRYGFIPATKDLIFEYINMAEEIGWDVLFFGGAFDHGLINNKIKGRYKNLLEVDHPSTNTTSSFAMTKEACVKILDTLYPVCNSVDWEFNYHFAANNFRVFHAFPYICGQASTSGRCESTLTLK